MKHSYFIKLTRFHKKPLSMSCKINYKNNNRKNKMILFFFALRLLLPPFSPFFRFFCLNFLFWSILCPMDLFSRGKSKGKKKTDSTVQTYHHTPYSSEDNFFSGRKNNYEKGEKDPLLSLLIRL